MNSDILIIICAVIIFTGIMYFMIIDCKPTKEGWIDYEQLPYGNVQSGAGHYNSNSSNGLKPPAFYKYPAYRKPYNYPVCHVVNYPVPHCRTDSL